MKRNKKRNMAADYKTLMLPRAAVMRKVNDLVQRRLPGRGNPLPEKD